MKRVGWAGPGGDQVLGEEDGAEDHGDGADGDVRGAKEHVAAACQ